MKNTPGKSRKLLWWILGAFILINTGIIATGNTYIYKALMYNLAGIDDLEIFNTRTINTASPQPWPISESYNKTALPPELQDELKRLKTVAFLVIKDDSIRDEHYWEGYSDTSLSNSFSMAKTFVAILIGCAIDDGYIKSLDQPLSDFLPSFKGSSVTLRHVITMSSGMVWDESYSSLFSITTKAYYGNDLASLIEGLKLNEPPGEKFRYQSGNSLLLAAVLNKVTGKSLSEYFEERIWKKIGAERPAKWSLDKENGIEKSYCCVYSNARDFARIGKLFMDKGMFNGERVISSGFVEESVSPAPLADDSGYRIDHYGYSWWIIPSFQGHYVYYARGLRGQLILVVPSKKIIVVRLGEKNGKRNGIHYPETFEYLKGVFKMYPG